jgi:hypothetical protein
MTSKTVEGRLRLFLLSLSGFMSLGTIVELWLTEHTKEALQLLPFVLCGLGLAVVVAVLLRPQRKTIWTLRIVMSVIALSSLLGVYEHLKSNLEVVLETKPNLATMGALWEAIRGAAPLLAPGILALTAFIALAATYYHPALGNRADYERQYRSSHTRSFTVA